MDRNQYSDAESVIDLKQLFFYVLRKWKILILCLVIGIAGGAAFSYLQSRDNDPNLIHERVKAMDTDSLNMKAIKQLADFNDLYESQLEYEEQSIIMSMDANDVYNGTISYFIKADIDSINDINARYVTMFDSNETLKRFLEVSGLDTNERGIRQMLKVTFRRYENDDAVIFYNDEKGRTALMTATLTAPDQASTEAMMQVLKEIISEVDRGLTRDYPGYSAALTRRTILHGFSQDLATMQDEATALRSGYLERITKLQSSMTEDELMYYYYYYRDAHTMTPEEIEAMEPVEYTPSVSKKTAVIFGLLLAVLAAVVLCVKYVLDGHVKTDLDVSGQFRTDILGYYDSRKKTGKIDRLLEGAARQGTDLPYLCDAVQALEQKKLLLCGDGADEALAALSEALVSGAENIGGAGDLLRDGAARTALAGADGALVQIHLWKTRKDELRRICEIAELQKKPVVGAIVVR